jgi:hypothetical protein
VRKQAKQSTHIYRLLSFKKWRQDKTEKIRNFMKIRGDICNFVDDKLFTGDTGNML